MFRILKRWHLAGSAAERNAGDGLLSIDEFRRRVDRERERSSRNRHAVSLVLMAAAPDGGKAEPTLRWVQSIRARIRQVDEIGWYDDSRLGIILPYTGRDGACRLTRDLASRLNVTPSDLRIEVFTFPGGPNDNAVGGALRATQGGPP